MAKIISIEKKRATYCKDCSENPKTCGKDPIKCQEKKDSKLYFELYNETAAKYRKM